MNYPGQWRAIVSTYVCYESSILPSRREKVFMAESGVPTDDVFACRLCPQGRVRAFPDQRSMISHQMRQHGHRKLARQYCSDSGVCPACGLNFYSRIRCIEHLSRAQKCKADMQDGRLTMLHADGIAEFDAADASLFAAARKQGRARPLATEPGPAKGPKRQRSSPK